MLVSSQPGISLCYFHVCSSGMPALSVTLDMVSESVPGGRNLEADGPYVLMLFPIGVRIILGHAVYFSWSPAGRIGSIPAEIPTTIKGRSGVTFADACK